MRLKRLDLIVKNPPEAATFLSNVLGLEIRESGEHFAEVVDTHGFSIMLSPNALVETTSAAGVILHVDVENVSHAYEEARRHGAIGLLEPTITDWGWEIAMVRGPEGSIIQFDRIIEPAPESL
jgi:uncharacterized glyoxalase superfamily protein PhnB